MFGLTVRNMTNNASTIVASIFARPSGRTYHTPSFIDSNCIKYLNSRIQQPSVLASSHATLSRDVIPRSIRSIQSLTTTYPAYTLHRCFHSSRSLSARDPKMFGYGPSRSPMNLGLVVVPQQSAYVIERFGKFNSILFAGLNLLIPMVDRIAYVHSLKETALEVSQQTAITRDNVTIIMDGVLYVKITDPYNASYGVQDPIFAVTQLAQTTMRSEIGKMTLDNTFEERENLNSRIVHAINSSSAAWGVQCMRYEIRDISPPPNVKESMDKQAEAERQKRADILNSEGRMQSEINLADGKKRSEVLRAEGEAEATLTRARANAEAIRTIASSIREDCGPDAVALRIAEQYVQAFSQLARSSTTMLLPSNASDPSSFIAQALSIYQNVASKASSSSPSTSSGAGGRSLDPTVFSVQDAIARNRPPEPIDTQNNQDKSKNNRK